MMVVNERVRQSKKALRPDVELRPVVSVCIANWNCRDLLRDCLLSLFEQEQGVPFEVIVADNASSDGAAEMVSAEFPQVKLLRNTENLGFSKANNQAAARSAGRYLFFINNDTQLAPHTLDELVAFTASMPDVGMVGPRLRGVAGETQISYRTKPTIAALLHRVSILRWTGLFRQAYYRYRRDEFDPNGVRAVEVLMGAAVFLPRTMFEAAGRWDEHYRFGAEDLDLSTQVGRHGRVVYCSDVEVLHHGRVSSRENVGFAAPNVAIGYVRYFRKAGSSPLALFAYKLLVTLDAPLQLLAKLLQGFARRLVRKSAKALKSMQAAAGYWHFLKHDLQRFWKA